ncbi:ATP phosphoribosyltransferase regulatory subunit [Sphingomonas sp. SUN039]|uniref:ATP phosphoribosyltransferase regulatory subunit n=1 Tax=Sphingomonas sp. SUN039 TaxID=2937787 RepID=UPI00216456F3|nr:ATP phosphoribosyltransferase regulatory subunit [Sphingomonas sp. SUN039]UVO52792.1 ATP phosphoribosyltransferase regulatory subunit [Sphingomonas sp. SUN039]
MGAGGLLPQGLRDRLPGEAATQARTVRALLDSIEGRGYNRVSPPLAEYEDGLAARLKSSRTDLARFVDPLSQRTLAIRPDITPQIARIVSTQLAEVPRPLRLAYAGPVLKLGATQLNPQREAMQVGAELIGDDSVAAACEITGIAVAALKAAGVEGITVDLTMPDLVQTLAGLLLSPGEIADLDALLDMKDAGGLAEAGYASWLPLIAATGPVAPALDALRKFDHAGLMTSRIAGIEAIAAELAGSGVRVTLDPTERHGFEYHSWFGFSLFLSSGTNAVGRGGCYTIAHGDGHDEAATGFSVYPDGFG